MNFLYLIYAKVKRDGVMRSFGSETANVASLNGEVGSGGGCLVGGFESDVICLCFSVTAPKMSGLSKRYRLTSPPLI